MVLVLLRGLDIEKEEYPLGVLIDHAVALLDVDYSKKDEPPEMLLQRKLGLDDSDANDSLPLRKQIKEIFVDNRRLSLEYIREGLTLGGRYLYIFFLQHLECVGVSQCHGRASSFCLFVIFVVVIHS